MSDVTRLFVAAKTFIRNKDGKILLVREAASPDATQVGKYSEVGGRMNSGETIEECLRREVREEVGLEIEIGRPFSVAEWRPMVRGEQWQVIAIFFDCIAKGETITLSAEHDHYIWIDPSEYKNYPVIEDIHRVFEEYLLRGKF